MLLLSEARENSTLPNTHQQRACCYTVHEWLGEHYMMNDGHDNTVGERYMMNDGHDNTVGERC